VATDFAVSLRRFLTDHLAGLRGCSPNTIASYRDAFKLLICYFRDERNIPPERLTLELIDVTAITEFLTWLRDSRHNSPSTCNQRLAAISSYFSWMQAQDPARMACCQDILAIPSSKPDQPAVAHLTVEQTRLLLALPDRSTRQGRRDATLLGTLYDTAARVQETADLTVRDIRLEDPAIVALTGKGRKTGTSRSTRTPRRCSPPTSPSGTSTVPATITAQCSSTNTTRNSAAAGSPGSSANTKPRQPIQRSPAPSSAHTS
jgi:integrase/recombinase XerD